MTIERGNWTRLKPGWVMRNFWRGWGLVMAIAEVFDKRLEAKAQRRAMVERMDRGLFSR